MVIVDVGGEEGGDEGGGRKGWARCLKVSLLAKIGLASSGWVRCVCTCWVGVIDFLIFSLLTTLTTHGRYDHTQNTMICTLQFKVISETSLRISDPHRVKTLL